MSVSESITPQWVNELTLELRRGRHVLLTGNVADAYPTSGAFGSVTDTVTDSLREQGCAIVGVHDIADGFAFETPRERSWFDDRCESGHAAARAQNPGRQPERNERVRAADEGFAQAAASRRSRRLTAPADALTAVRSAVSQHDQHVGVILNMADLTFPGGDSPSQDELRPLALLAKAIREASFLPAVDGINPRNTIVLITPQPSAALSRYVANEPQIATIEVPVPSAAERHTFLTARARQFYGADGVTEQDLARHTEALTRLTDGLRTWDLEALRRTSLSEEASLESPRHLATQFAIGRRTSPWDETRADVFSTAGETLRQEVLGQDVVIEAVCKRLLVARHGVGFDDESGRRARRPRATFFFAGPTGVGKTELAKALARLLFGDHSALITFDMTEYRDRTSAARLTGSDPGFVGFEQGGQLVNAVRARPFSILLFDEIEKAHASVLDLFIGILDEGRLTDGHGRTASFADTIVIFTSNAGADRLAERIGEGEQLDADEVREHFVTAVREKLSLPRERDGIGRPELFGRLRGGVMGFDLLRPELLDRLTAKFLAQWRANVTRVYGVRTEVDERVFFRLVWMQLGARALTSGARTLETDLRELLELPLAELVAQQRLPAGSTIRIVPDLEARTVAFRVLPGDTGMATAAA